MNKAQKVLKQKREDFMDQLAANCIEFDKDLQELVKQIDMDSMGYVFKYNGKHIFQIFHDLKKDEVMEIDFVTDEWVKEMGPVYFDNNAPETSSVKINGKEVEKITVVAGQAKQYEEPTLH